MKTKILAKMKTSLLFILIVIFYSSVISAQVNFIWGKQFGTNSDEKARNLVMDSSGNAYVFGKTDGKLGNENFGKNDGFIVKIDESSNIIWARQFGSKDDDDIQQASIDKFGNIYLTGYIGSDKEKLSYKNDDVLVMKLNNDGEIIWQKQYGTDSFDIGRDLVVDNNGDVFVFGETKGKIANTSKGMMDYFILHLDNDGNQLNVVQFGSSKNDRAFGISLGSDSNIYVCGATGGRIAEKNVGKSDAFWGVFSNKLVQLKMKQFGTNEHDNASSITTDKNNNIYISGTTSGDIGAKQIGVEDAYIRKMNERGEIIWTKQFGTEKGDYIHGLNIINDKDILISGCQNYPECQAFCRMYDEDGKLLWKRNYVVQGDGGGTCGKGVCINQEGFIYHAGYTGANLFAKLSGEHDLFLIKLKLEQNNYE